MRESAVFLSEAFQLERRFRPPPEPKTVCEIAFHRLLAGRERGFA
jgi:hypothetical protein